VREPVDVAVDVVFLAVAGRDGNELSEVVRVDGARGGGLLQGARGLILVRRAKMRLQVSLELDVRPGLLARCVGLLPPTRRCGLV